jgi:glycosyltransferase involved in cell wall biosynthesis
MQSLRIAQVLASGPVHGGLEKHFVQLCNGLSERHEVLALAHPAHGTEMDKRVEFQPLDFAFSRHSPINFFRLHRSLKHFRPDVIHAHANKAAAIIAALNRFYAARTVGTVHGFKSNNRVFSHFDSVIAVSPAIYEHLGLPRTQVVCNGIEPVEAPPHDPQYFLRQFNLSQERPVVITVGRLAAVKGYDGLIAAWPGIEADLLIIGEGPERAKLERLVKRLDLKDRVFLIGYRDDVPAIMAHSDLVVIASQREGFPYTMVEALHHEKPIVATSFPGATALLPARYVVPYGQTEQLHDAIHSTLCNQKQARQDYQAIWQEAKERFTVASMVDQTSAVYSQLFHAAA